MTSTIGKVVSFPARGAGAASGAMSRTASSIASATGRVTEPRPGTVDDWGRDPDLVRRIISLSRVRWNVTVGGDQHLPRRKGALIVINARRFALAPIMTAFAISDAVGRPVRFVGRPDTAPVGAFDRRIGGLLHHPDEVGGALRAGELVVMGASHDPGSRKVGTVDHTLVGAALAAAVSVFPGATSSRPLGRDARVEIGKASRVTRKRRGPLAELELADRVRVDIGMLLDEMGDLGTGTPLDWLPFGGMGGS